MAAAGAGRLRRAASALLLRSPRLPTRELSAPARLYHKKVGAGEGVHGLRTDLGVGVRGPQKEPMEPAPDGGPAWGGVAVGFCAAPGAPIMGRSSDGAWPGMEDPPSRTTLLQLTFPRCAVTLTAQKNK